MIDRAAWYVQTVRNEREKNRELRSVGLQDGESELPGAFWATSSRNLPGGCRCTGAFNGWKSPHTQDVHRISQKHQEAPLHVFHRCNQQMEDLIHQLNPWPSVPFCCLSLFLVTVLKFLCALTAKPSHVIPSMCWLISFSVWSWQPSSRHVALLSFYTWNYSSA